MHLKKLGVKKEANVILGAGATRGASCFEKLWVDAPLDADFFDQIDKLKHTEKGKGLSSLSEFVRDEFGPEVRIRMEPFFTQVESLSVFHNTLNITPGPKVRQYAKILDRFVEDLALVFHSLRDLTGESQLRCNYHDLLADSLQSGDTVLSFNNEALNDHSIREKARKSWNAEKGYGIDISSGANYWHDHTGRGLIAKNSIQLLKVHGSLNWKRTGDEKDNIDVELREDPYESNERCKSEVVPPVWNKRISEDKAFTEIWKKARGALNRGPILMLIGYSVPDTDLLSQSLLRVATAEKNRTLSHLIIINPSISDRNKTRQLLRQSLNSSSTIIELNSISEMEKIL